MSEPKSELTHSCQYLMVVSLLIISSEKLPKLIFTTIQIIKWPERILFKTMSDYTGFQNLYNTLHEKYSNTEYFLACISLYSDWIRGFIINLRIHVEYRKIRTRKNSLFGHFSRSDKLKKNAFPRIFFVTFSNIYDIWKYIIY